MRFRSKLVVIAGLPALGALPAVALGAAGGHPIKPTTHTTGTGQPSKAKAYGKLAKKLLKQKSGG